MKLRTKAHSDRARVSRYRGGSEPDLLQELSPGYLRSTGSKKNVKTLSSSVELDTVSQFSKILESSANLLRKAEDDVLVSVKRVQRIRHEIKNDDNRLSEFLKTSKIFTRSNNNQYDAVRSLNMRISQISSYSASFCNFLPISQTELKNLLRMAYVISCDEPQIEYACLSGHLWQERMARSLQEAETTIEMPRMVATKQGKSAERRHCSLPPVIKFKKVKESKMRPLQLLQEKLKDSVNKSDECNNKLNEIFEWSVDNCKQTESKSLRGNFVHVTHVARNRALTKLFTAMEHLRERKLSEALETWKLVSLSNYLNHKCGLFLKGLSVCLLQGTVNFMLYRRLKRGWDNWKRHTDAAIEELMEQSAVKIQLLLRSRLSRKKLLSKRQEFSSKKIQAIFRGKRARTTVKDIKQSNLEKKSICAIQRSWRKKSKYMKSADGLERQKLEEGSKVIQKSWKQKKRRDKVKLSQKNKKEFKSASVLQSQWRSKLARDETGKLRQAKAENRSAIIIQSRFRGHKCKSSIGSVITRSLAARKIQRVWKVHITRKRLMNNSAKSVQKVVRGKLGREKFKKEKVLVAHRKDQKSVNSAVVIQGAIRGRIDRKRVAAIRNITNNHKSWIVIRFMLKVRTRMIQHKKAMHIQCAFRQRQSRMIVDKKRHELFCLQAKACTLIQSVGRMFIAKSEFKMLLRRDRRRRKQLEQLPTYYRLRLEYIDNQNLSFYEAVTNFNKLARGFMGRRRFERIKKEKCSILIQTRMRSKLAMNEADRRQKARLIECERKQHAAILIQSISRVIIIKARFRVMKKRCQSALTLQKFFRRAVRISRFFVNIKILAKKMRERTIRKVIEAQSATLLQRVSRGKTQRVKYKTEKNALEIERRKRENAIANAAMLLVQLCWRCHVAKKTVKTRRIEIAAEFKRKQKMLELDEQIEAMHNENKKHTMALRIQCGYRRHQSAKVFSKKLLALQSAAEGLLHRKHNTAAQTIQKAFRGFYCRKLFVIAKTSMKLAVHKRRFCVQCDRAIAVRKCKDCRGDKFCDSCFNSIHSKGNRRLHTWDRIADPFDISDVLAKQGKSTRTRLPSSKTSKAKSTGGPPPGQPSIPSKSKYKPVAQSEIKPVADWVEYYDNSAQASYWYNTITGEATWISPP